MPLVQIHTRDQLLDFTGPGDRFASAAFPSVAHGWALPSSGSSSGEAATVAMVLGNVFHPPSVYVWGARTPEMLDELAQRQLIAPVTEFPRTYPSAYPTRSEHSADQTDEKTSAPDGAAGALGRPEVSGEERAEDASASVSSATASTSSSAGAETVDDIPVDGTRARKGGHAAGVLSRPFADVSVRTQWSGALASRFGLGSGARWWWMSIRRSPTWLPVHPDGPPVTLLDDARDAEEIRALAAAENPLFEGDPGKGTSMAWVGARDASGKLIACATLHRTGAGVPHLSGVLVARRARRLGLGAAMSARLTAEAVARAGRCTLGVYGDNHAAITMYGRLGYRADAKWFSTSITDQV